jgi:hypothetical protein
MNFDLTLISLLSRFKSSAPRISCEIKMEEYSPSDKLSSHAPTSSGVQLRMSNAATDTENV